MTVKRNMVLESCAWLVGISLVPLWNIAKGKETAYWLFIEALAVLLLIFTYLKKKKTRILYDSEHDEINIAGSKEGFYDPDSIMKNAIVDVECEERALVIKMNDGRKIRIKGLGKRKQGVFEDLLRICREEK